MAEQVHTVAVTLDWELPAPTSQASRLAAPALALLLAGCDALFGKEVARLPVEEVSTEGHEIVKEATLSLKKDDKIALWSDMALSYQGAAPLRFQVQVLKDGAPFKQLELDPSEKNMTLNEVKTAVNDNVRWRFTGKNGELLIPADGTYLFRARLVAAPNPSLHVSKAELVLKK